MLEGTKSIEQLHFRSGAFNGGDIGIEFGNCFDNIIELAVAPIITSK